MIINFCDANTKEIPGLICTMPEDCHMISWAGTEINFVDMEQFFVLSHKI